MTAHILTIGDELLIGQVIDTNSAWIGERLNDIGVAVRKVSTVGDEEASISKAIQESAQTDRLVLITGGLGPTKDDVTKKALAHYFDSAMVFSQPTWDRIQRMFERWGRNTTPAHYQQCYMPEAAELLFNKMGSAPGMWFEKEGQIFVSMPGVPYEMKYIMEQHVLPRLQERFSGTVIVHRTIRTAGEGESRLAERIHYFEADLPPEIKLAYLPNLGHVRLRLTAKGTDRNAVEALLDQQVEKLQALIPDLIFGYGEDSLEMVVGRMLRERSLKLATAESCTGGYLAHLITSVAGSSDYFSGSVVAYSNAVKVDQLGVRPETLEKYGAVSEQTVIEMAQGVRSLLGTDIGVGISGIAGPGGGTAEKPVGTIWLAVADKNQTQTDKLQLGKDRLINIQYTGNFTLNFIRRFVESSQVIK